METQFINMIMIHVVSNDIGMQWYTKTLYICSLTNVVDTDEMPYNHCLHR